LNISDRKAHKLMVNNRFIILHLDGNKQVIPDIQAESKKNIIFLFQPIAKILLALVGSQTLLAPYPLNNSYKSHQWRLHIQK